MRKLWRGYYNHRRRAETFAHKIRRPVTRDDIIRLTEIRIKRISAYNTFEADKHIEGVEKEMAEVKHNLDNLTDYAIQWFEYIKKNSVKEEKDEPNCDILTPLKLLRWP